jgi:hypothetical protein
MTEAQGTQLIEQGTQMLAYQQGVADRMEAVGRLCAVGLWLIVAVVGLLALRRMVGK